MTAVAATASATRRLGIQPCLLDYSRSARRDGVQFASSSRARRVFFMAPGIDFVLIVRAARRPEVFCVYALVANGGRARARLADERPAAARTRR